MNDLPASAQTRDAVTVARQVRDRVRRDHDPLLARARRQARRNRLIRRVQRFVIMAIAGMIALIIGSIAWWILIDPLGFLGVLLLPILGFLILMGAFWFSREARIRPQAIGRSTNLPQIAAQADEYLHQTRRALPAPAQELTDMIGQRLAGLGPQLARIDPGHPDARELKRLVGNELPELIDSYRHVPAQLRRADRNGRVPERDLIDGLKLVDTRIEDIAQTLGADDMDRLSSHKRYLEMRYQGDTDT